MKEINLMGAETADNPHGVHMSRLFGSEKAQVAHVLLKPGESIPPHGAPATALFYVIGGRGTATVGDEEKEIAADTLIECPPNAAHGWANTSDTELRILAIKIPE
jgi:quercetin dioxygenase-like cupin family protein